MKKIARGIREAGETLFVFAVLFTFYLILNSNIK